VYDELLRRQLAEDSAQECAWVMRGFQRATDTLITLSRSTTANPFLPVRQDFHPKRNQARQKLATLPKNRFKDLASDVFFELRRRYPEFEEQAIEVRGTRGGLAIAILFRTITVRMFDFPSCGHTIERIGSILRQPTAGTWAGPGCFVVSVQCKQFYPPTPVGRRPHRPAKSRTPSI
jgi:hypothetical protein